MRSHLEYCISFWVPQYSENTDILKAVQRRANKVIRELEHSMYTKMFKELFKSQETKT